MRLPACEFLRYVEQEIDALPAETMRSKNTPEAKKLIEELRALSRLALALKFPGLEIDVEVTPDGSEADGIIFERGFRDRELKIQIAYSFDHEEAMRMELLNKQGHAPGAGPIHRDKKTKMILAELEAVNSDEHIQRCTQEIIRLYEKKVAKNYKTKMVLLIGFSELKLKGLPTWLSLYENIRNKLNLKENNFIAVYLFNEASNEIYQVA